MRRNLLYDAILRDWVILKGIDEIKPSGQSGGDPRANGQINGLFRHGWLIAPALVEQALENLTSHSARHPGLDPGSMPHEPVSGLASMDCGSSPQ